MKPTIITEKQLKDIGKEYTYCKDTRELLMYTEEGDLLVHTGKKTGTYLIAKNLVNKGIDNNQFSPKYAGYIDPDTDEVFYEETYSVEEAEEVEEEVEYIEEEPQPEDEVVDQEWLDAKSRFKDGVKYAEKLKESGVKLNTNKLNAWKRTAKDIDSTDPEKLKSQFKEMLQFANNNKPAKEETVAEKKTLKVKEDKTVKELQKKDAPKKKVSKDKTVENEEKPKKQKKAKRIFPDTINIDGFGKYRIATGKYNKYKDFREAVEEEKDLVIANHLTKKDIVDFDLNEVYGIEPPVMSHPQDLDLTYPMLACTRMDKFHTVSFHTEAVYFYWGDSLEEFINENGEVVREFRNMEYQIYEAI